MLMTGNRTANMACVWLQAECGFVCACVLKFYPNISLSLVNITSSEFYSVNVQYVVFLDTLRFRPRTSGYFSDTAMKTYQCFRARNQAPDRNLSDRNCIGIHFVLQLVCVPGNG